MEYGTVAGVEKRVSRLAHGTIMLTGEDQEPGFALLDEAFAAGVNTFDTAHVYAAGECDRALGEWIASRGNRDEVVIIGKGAHPNADRHRVTPFDIASDLHDSLARMKADCIDLYLLHRDDPSVAVGPIVEALNEHVKAGRIRAFGGSNWTHERLAEANAYAEERGLQGFVASSPHVSLAEMVNDPWGGCISLTGEHQAGARAWYAENQMPVFAWSSLSRGFFSGRFTPDAIRAMPEDSELEFVHWYRSEANLTRLARAFELAERKGVTVPQLATAYVLHLPMNLFALVGCLNPGEIAALNKSFDITLTDKDMAYLDLRE
jgi:aryl-alcohol dehydrogenase-like predicted oxidoreductase